jgi:pimeloyl-ACP methyl ester carboxylesterase
MLNYIEEGHGPAVVLVHGMAASLHDWDGMVPALVQSGFRTLAVDLLGHGDSPKPDDPQAYTIESLYENLEQWVCDLDSGKPFILIGHSLGGYLSLELSLKHPECIQALILINPLYKADQLSRPLRLLRRQANWGPDLVRRIPLWLVQAFLDWFPLFRDNLPGQARRQIAADFKRASPQILSTASQIPDLTPELSKIHIPSLVVWSGEDLTLNPKSFPELVNRLPDAAGYYIPHCGHQTHIIKSEKVRAETINFLKQHRLN